MLVDTHCHLDAAEFDADRPQIAQLAYAQGVGCIVVPAVHRSNFDAVISLAKHDVRCQYALGIHPMYVEASSEQDLVLLDGALKRQLNSAQPPVAIGEIGLDYFVPNFDRQMQEMFFVAQLKLAKAYDLPVILHVRRSVDDILKHLRRFKLKGGIAHAFNGSRQQADEFIKLGFKLGFGGAMTYTRALKIRELAATLPLEAIVLETDAPDIPPEWIGHGGRNSPDQLIKVAQVLADIRGLNLSQVTEMTTKNALQVLPKIADLCTPPQVLL